MLNTPQKISKIYFDSKKIGISLSARAALINIARADKRPNNTVGLKLEKTKTNTFFGFEASFGLQALREPKNQKIFDFSLKIPVVEEKLVDLSDIRLNLKTKN